MRLLRIFLMLLFANSCFAIKAKWDSDRSGWSPLMVAAYNNDVDSLRYYLSIGWKVSEQSKSGYTPLMISARKGNYRATKYLLTHQANPNLCDTSGETSLFFACEQKKARVVKLLLRFDANPSHGIKGTTPLTTAVCFSTVRIVRVLIAHGVEINSRSTVDSMTALGLASYFSYESKEYKRKYRLLKRNGAVL